jgi:hypothetical protein
MKTKQLLQDFDLDKTFTFIAHVIGFVGFCYMLLNAVLRTVWPPLVIVGLSLIGGVLFMVVRLQMLIAVSSKNKYHFVDLDKGGSSLSEQIRNARRCIKTTHFTKEPPSEGYIGTLIDKLNEEVHICRLVFLAPDRKDEYNWLNRFRNLTFYNEYSSHICLPFNIVIIDDQKVWLFFPVTKEGFYRQAVWFDDPDLGKLFAAAFDTLVDKYGSNSKPAAAATAHAMP